MASGSFSNNFRKGFTVKVDWSSTQNITANTSNLTVNISLVAASGYYINSSAQKNIILTINGTAYSDKCYVGLDRGETKVIYTKTVSGIAHNADGSKSVAISVDIDFNVAFSGETATRHIITSGTATLDTIPRASTVACTSVNIGSNPTITITKAVSSFTHTLKYSFGPFNSPLTGTIVEKTSASTYSSWTVPTSFYAKIPDAKNGICTITCETYNGNTLIGSKQTTFTATAAKSLCDPVFSLELTDANEITKALTGDASNKFIKYHSNVSYNTNAAPRNSATLKSQEITCNGVKRTTATGTFNNVESATFTVTATDSREYTSSYTTTKTLIDYVRITSNIEANLSTDGVLTLKLNGNCFNGSFGARTNTLTLQYRYKNGSGYSAWTTVSDSSVSRSGNTYSTTVTVSGLDYRNQYTVQARAMDLLETKNSVELSIRSLPVFDWGENDFAFHVPVTINNATVPSIEAQGTSGDWYYRKWSDGTSECWCTKTFEVSVTNTWGSLFTSGMIAGSNLALPSGLFITMPTVITSLSTTALGGILMAPGGTGSNTTSATYTGALEIARGTSSAGTYIINYQVKGRWK